MAVGTATTPHTYPHGVTCWIDTEQPDPAAAMDFYGGLFGWRFSEAVPPGVPGSYLIGAVDGHDAGAIAPADPPARWNTYVAVRSVEATLKKVERAGGSVLSPARDVGEAGRGAAIADPHGAELRLWQPGRRLGSQINNAYGSWNFSDLHTDDIDAVLPFYRELFGWKIVDMGLDAAAVIVVPGYGDHLQATVDPDIRERQAGAPTEFADAIGGITKLSPGERPHWHVTVLMKSRDRAAEEAERLGGTVLETADERWSRKARIRDPQGAVFSVNEFRMPED